MALYLVTGGVGFIWSHLVDALLARGDRVRVLDDLSTGKRDNLDPAAELIVGDVADATAVAGAMRDIDGCFHLAAIASVELGNRDWLGYPQNQPDGSDHNVRRSPAGKSETASDTGRLCIVGGGLW